jgi:adenylosuccinate lyase|tara:strand:- start:544 stop:1917 length:1374 start_codon:yes stop_codon:yes gene_type:complete
MKKFLLSFCIVSSSLFVFSEDTVSDIFKPNYKNQLFMDVEVALAEAQSELEIIPLWAAKEISSKANIKYLSQKDIDEEHKLVRHTLVARLNVWKRSIDAEAAEYLHYGATTVDIWDTVLVLQIKDSIDLLIDDLLEIEDYLLTLTKDNLNTYMPGRTLGQHALPITFGKKTSTWLAENRRNIERLQHVQSKINKSGILKGAVGSYLGLGDMAIETESLMMQKLGLDEPSKDDWHGIRDVFAEYALTLAIVSKSFGRIGNELTLLQMTEIGETEEYLGSRSVGSSTMPQKKNPRGPGDLIEYSRVIPRLSEIVLDDMVNSFERDGQKSDDELRLISIESEKMINRAKPLLKELKVNKDKMRENLDITNGLILSQRLTFYLADKIGKDTANDLMHDVAKYALENNISLEEAALANKTIQENITKEALSNILNPETYIGLAVHQAQLIINEIESKRKQIK